MLFNVLEAQSEILQRQILPQFLEILDDESSTGAPPNWSSSPPPS